MAGYAARRDLFYWLAMTHAGSPRSGYGMAGHMANFLFNGGFHNHALLSAAIRWQEKGEQKKR